VDCRSGWLKGVGAFGTERAALYTSTDILNLETVKNCLFEV